jgi:cell wall-associated NlpC family hydrolase
VAVSALATAVLVGQPAVGHATPPPPDPPDDQVAAARQHAESVAGQVGRLTNQVAEADAALLALQSEVELKREKTNKALIELQAARSAAAAAQAAARDARAGADAAGRQITDARHEIDQFAAASYRQGSTLGSASAFLGSDGPNDVLARAELLGDVGAERIDALQDMRRARIQAANADARARQTVVAARSAAQATAGAMAAADSAYQGAMAAATRQAGQAAALVQRKSGVERQLTEAQNTLSGLAGQRQRYAQWTLDRDRAQPAPVVDARAGVLASTVISRAMAQRGVRYSWGGGDAHGATPGIRDGGIADRYGDYRTAGFDCSGLMIYAFAPVLGYSLPHYSGAQYDAGRKVPMAKKRPGDMLFWSLGGEIHHVALYLGNEQMIEAPYSGGAVRVTAVRYNGIQPYAVRML